MSNELMGKRIPEELEFVPNKGTFAARKIVVLKPNIVVELWFNKHYYERFYLGDKRGKRVGIDPSIVESLVARSLEHLFLYSTILKEFNFVNYRVNKKSQIRIELQEAKPESTLNVVIEVHPLSINRFEITVITALVVDNFKIAAGQFCVKLQQDRSSLKKFDNGQFFEICDFKFP